MRRERYAWLRDRLKTLSGGLHSDDGAEVLADLVQSWGDTYRRFRPTARIFEVPLEGFNYLFDVAEERNIAAFGFMRGKNTSKRDSPRQRKYPKAEPRAFHRGHMIPHSGHGGNDINLFIQRGEINNGPFHRLENLAVSTPNSFYFVHLIYSPHSQSSRPSEVEQGLILAGPPATLDEACFPN